MRREMRAKERAASGLRGYKPARLKPSCLIAQQDALPGRAGIGQMTYEEILTLPKPHPINKKKKVLLAINGLKPKDVVHYLPPVGDLLRS